jgi:hypothetical protein
MRTSFALASLSTVAVALVWACSNSNDNPQVVVGTDAASEAGEAGADTGDLPDVGGPGPDASRDICTLSDHVTDPVAICIQEQVLGFETSYAYAKGQGVAPTWSSTAPYAPGSGHNWQDDLGLAGALGAYYCSSEVYGNNHSSAAFGAVLLDLGTTLVTELQANPPTGYDGETYFRLRWAQAAFNYANDAHATALKAMADAYGAGLAAQAYAVAPSAGDAGSDGADGGDAGAAGSPGGTVIGTKNADGSVAYAPVQTIMAAAALLDMATLHAHDADGGATTQGWAATAQQVLTYVLARGRDPVRGLFYQSLVTSGDPGHDALGTARQFTNDTFLTEDQAWIMLAFARAQDLVNLLATLPAADGGDASPGATPLVYSIAGADLAAAVTSANLFDGTTTPGTPPPVGAFMEGLGPSGVLTDKTTIGNAIILGGLHRLTLQQGSAQAYTLGEARSALTQVLPANTSLLSIVTDSNGNPEQQSYLRAGSKSYGYAVAYGAGGDAGLEPNASAYRSDAVHAFIEGMTQLWHGAANNPSCAP